MKLTQTNDVKVYTVSGSDTGRSLPDWLARKRKRSLKNDLAYQSRIELIQDFGFPEASNRVRVTEDGQWCMATGTYKPQMRIFDFNSLSMSFDRHTNIENLTFLLLEDSWRKSVHLQIDRYIEFHTPMGLHHSLRIPHYGRDLVYCRWAAEVLVPAEGREVYRINLERGGFMKPFEVNEEVKEVLTGVQSDVHGLLAFGTDLGTTELWDPRVGSRVATVERASTESITALAFDPTGLQLATGNAEGLVRLYDLRSPMPLLTKDQGYSYPIQNLIYLPPVHSESETKLLSADKRIIKIWSPSDGTPWTSIEPSVDINDIAHVKGSGMLFTANEGPDMHTFFIPELGPAPKWCSFLDNVTEEMEESVISGVNGEVTATTYDNYKFLTKPQLEQLSLSHLVGSSVLRPYMHGYFVKQELYEQARLIANPWGWEEQRKRMVQERIEKEREGRIRSSGKKVASKVKVNQKLAERLAKLEEKLDRRAARKAEKEKEKAMAEGDEDMEGEDEAGEEKAQEQTKVMEDPRFKDLWTNPDFEVDETSFQYMLHNPSSRPTADGANGDTRKRLTAVEEEDAESSNASSDEESSSSESEPEEKPKKQFKEKKAPIMRISTASYRTQGHSSKESGPARKEQSFGSRMAAGEHSRKRERNFSKGQVYGDTEFTYKVEKKQPGGKSDVQRPVNRGGNADRRKDRRSASGNTFRRMGV
ncbi:hypothetical protein TWF569_010059 [Orbilia oligospora]|uniref:Uncharacterized protein n=1 Tax=Orbilia oligospora TaxID=2813651 RepID=A0A7C8NZC9_ORBOL|nr:hypothetical protein TWF102_006895 [Orbilia oligospora]KAF3105555.1 hypothetical protein TWF103_006614 [Orbilia oligospora]KAF3121504.1 hypothetical protein TWF703_001904 [Orbilia oligospora]KAF3134792.1 hypothetical protein TWF569_010059 [Orbilia oligospora]